MWSLNERLNYYVLLKNGNSYIKFCFKKIFSSLSYLVNGEDYFLWLWHVMRFLLEYKVIIKQMLRCCIGGFSWVLGLERGPLGLVSTIEGLLRRKSSGSGLESREYGRRDPPRWPRFTLYPQKLALNSPTSGCLSVIVVRSRTQATEFDLF
jgi:hypothetical protein